MYEDDDSKATKKQSSKHDQAVSNLFRLCGFQEQPLVRLGSVRRHVRIAVRDLYWLDVRRSHVGWGSDWEACARNSGVVKVIEKHLRGGRRAGTACAKRICRSVCVFEADGFVHHVR